MPTLPIADLKALAQDAYPRNDWGSERQIAAENAFFAHIEDLPEAFDTLKATGRNLIDNGLAFAISAKWFNLIGFGFHPDTRGADYSPPLSQIGDNETEADYDRDMELLFSLDADPYEWGAYLMARA